MPKKTRAPVVIRDRIKEFRRVKGADLIPHPHNWRTHPGKQRTALQGVLADIGYANALVVRELSDGRLQLIDGHLRAETTPDMDVPVLIVDVSDEEADKLLLTLDPLSALAGVDSAAVDTLLQGVQFSHSEILDVLADSWQKSQAEYQNLPTAQLMSEPSSTSEIEQTPAELAERYCVLIQCTNEAQQLTLLQRFEEEGLACRALIT